MTWTLKLRGDPTGTIAHEYLCPEHGRFTAEVSRADAPDEVPCPLTESFERWHIGPDGTPDYHDIDVGNACGLTSPWSPSTIIGRVKAGEVIRGKVADYPSEHNVMDTRPLADGMPLSEFKARRAKVHGKVAVAKMRKLTGRTGKVMR